MMKILAVVMFLAACGNKSPSGATECTAAIESAVQIGMRAQIEGQHLGDSTVAAMKAVSVTHCNDDKWSVDTVSCLKASTTNDAINKCLDGIPTEQRMKWQQDMAAELAKAAKAAGSSSGSAGSAGSGSAGSGSGTAVVQPTGIPEECVAYTKLMERLATCEAFPKAQRDGYQAAYTQISASFASVTPEARAQMAQGCQSTVDVIKNSAGATCGW